MRYSLLCLVFFSALAMAEAVPSNFNQAEFEKRFRAADTNKDSSITLIEVNKAMERRVNAAMGAGDAWKNPAMPAEIGSEQTATVIEAEPATQFSSKQEARRYHRYKYYESLAEEQDVSRNRGESGLPKAPPNLLQKSF